MASLQAPCTTCENRVTAFTLLGDNDLEPLLQRNEKIMVGHVFQESPGKSLDHQWSLGDEEIEKLRKLIQFMARGKKRLGHRP